MPTINPEPPKASRNVFFSAKQNAEGQTNLEACRVNLLGRTVRYVLKAIGINDFYGNTYTSTIRNYFKALTDQPTNIAASNLQRDIKAIGGDVKFDALLRKTFKGKEKDAALMDKINQLRSQSSANTPASENPMNSVESSNFTTAAHSNPSATNSIGEKPTEGIDSSTDELPRHSDLETLKSVANLIYPDTKQMDFIKNYTTASDLQDLHKEGKLSTTIIALAPKSQVEQFYSGLNPEEKKTFVRDFINPKHGARFNTENILQQLPAAEINEWIHFLESPYLIRSLPRETLDYLSDDNIQKFKEDVLNSPNFNPSKYIGVLDWKDIFAHRHNKPADIDQAAVQYDKDNKGTITAFLKNCTDKEFKVFCFLFAFTNRYRNLDLEEGFSTIENYADNPTSFGKIKFDPDWSDKKKELFARYKNESGNMKVPIEWPDQLKGFMTNLEKAELINFVKYNKDETNAFLKDCSPQEFKAFIDIYKTEPLIPVDYDKSWSLDKKQMFVDQVNAKHAKQNLETYSSITAFENTQSD